MNIEESNTDALHLVQESVSFVPVQKPQPFEILCKANNPGDNREVIITMPVDGMFQLCEWLIGVCHELGIPMEIERKGFKENGGPK